MTGRALFCLLFCCLLGRPTLAFAQCPRPSSPIPSGTYRYDSQGNRLVTFYWERYTAPGACSAREQHFSWYDTSQQRVLGPVVLTPNRTTHTVTVTPGSQVYAEIRVATQSAGYTTSYSSYAAGARHPDQFADTWGLSHPGELSQGNLGSLYYQTLLDLRPRISRIQASWEKMEPKQPSTNASNVLPCNGELQYNSEDNTWHCFVWDAAGVGEIGFIRQLTTLSYFGIETFVVVDPFTNIDRNVNTLLSSWRCHDPQLPYIECLPLPGTAQERHWYFFIKNLVTRFKHEVKTWQVFNEIDFSCESGPECPDEYIDDYARLVPNTFSLIKGTLRNEGISDSKTLWVLKKARAPEDVPLLVKEIVDRGDRFIDFYGYNNYPDEDNYIGSQQDIVEDLNDSVRRWNYASNYVIRGKNIGPKFKWVTEIGGTPSNFPEKIERNFDEHDFILAKNWYKYFLWLHERTSKTTGRTPELVSWFRLYDKPDLERTGNKANGFLYTTKSWYSNRPEDLSQKLFFIQSVQALMDRIGDFAEIRSISGLPNMSKSDSLIQRFRITLKNGKRLYLAWNQYHEDTYLSYNYLTGGDIRDGEVIRTKFSLNKNPELGYRAATFSGKAERINLTTHTGFTLMSESNPNTGRFYIIERP